MLTAFSIPPRRTARQALASAWISLAAISLPAIALAGPAAQAPPRDIEVTVPPEPAKKAFDPLQAGPRISPEQAEARRHKCARATDLAKQANSFQDESPLSVRYYREALDLCPGHPEANFRLGVIAYHKKDIERAIQSFERAVKSDVQFVDGYYNLAIIYRRLKKLKEARKYFLAALKHDPHDALSLYNMGVLEYVEQQRDRALVYFRKSAATAPRLAEPHFFIGAIFQERGKYDEAKKELHAAIRLGPRLTLPRVYLSAILEMEGKSQDAARELNKAIEINEASVNVGYDVDAFYFNESRGTEILSHMRVRKVVALPKEQPFPEIPLKEPPKAKAPPEEMAPPKAPKETVAKADSRNTGKMAPSAGGSPKKEAKKNFGPAREAREIPVKPAAGNKRAPKRETTTYRVRRGDTLGKIANRHGAPLKTLIELNHNQIEHPSVIEVGDVIYIPKQKASTLKPKSQKPQSQKPRARKRPGRLPYRVHRIDRGDTLAKIAKRYGTDIPTLMRLNRKRIPHPDYIEEGMRLLVPATPRRVQAKK